MLFPIIKIKDMGTERIVGTNRHDCLYIENNAIHYLDIQSMGSTESEEDGIYFTGVDKGEYSFTGNPEIEFLTLEEVIELATESVKEQTNDVIKANEAYKRHKDEREKCKQRRQECAKRTGISMGGTGGYLF